ncbi:MAG: IPT/TIG domain-containing protein [Pseudonocardiaceae bacterium]
MRIDSIIPNPAQPGSTVIIQGDDLSAVERVFLGDLEASFDIDGEVLEVRVPDGAGTFDVTVEGADGKSDPFSFEISES